MQVKLDFSNINNLFHTVWREANFVFGLLVIYCVSLSYVGEWPKLLQSIWIWISLPANDRSRLWFRFCTILFCVKYACIEMYILYFSTLFRYKIIPTVVFKVKWIFSSRFYDSSCTAEMWIFIRKKHTVIQGLWIKNNPDVDSKSNF